MRQSRKRIAVAAAGVVLVALGAAGVIVGRRILPILSYGAGLKAGHMCSAAFVAGRSPDAALREELGNVDPRLRYVPDPVVDPATQSATVRMFLGLIERRAVYRDCFGCTLLPPGADLDDVAAIPSAELPMPEGDPTEIPWPDGDLSPDAPPPPEVNEVALAAAVERAFSSPEYDPHLTIGVVVVYRDRIIAERYAPGFDAHTQSRTWSSAKSITNALVGIMVGEGQLVLDAPAPIPAWRAPGDPRGAITLNDLMHMSSGLASGGAFTPEAYWGGIDTAAAVVQGQLEATPGTRWQYSNYDTLLLVRSIQEVVGDRTAYLTLPRRALLNKIGMRDTVLEVDAYGNYILSSQVYTTSRDLARLGLLFLHDGVWHGERILPEGWVAYTATPAPACLQLEEDHRAYGGYGAQFWLYGRDGRVPTDTYSTSGARGQHATIVPSRDLVVVRMGLDPLQDSGWDQPGFVVDVLGAIASPVAG